ncbi:MAG: hypothetical protein KF830_05755 [Planctomycetes bacterium]|nr:hypothetical protein [Planctomycetota bacterium]
MNSTSNNAVSAGPMPSLGGAPAELHRLRARARRGLWLEALGSLGLLLLGYAVPTLVTDRSLRLEWIFRCLLLASFVVVLVRVVRRRLVTPLAVPLTAEELALAVERRAPDLAQSLISALQFERDLRGGGASAGIESPALKANVVEGLARRAGSIPFARAIDARRVRRFALAAVGVLAVFGLWAWYAPGSLAIWAQRNLLLTNVDWPRRTELAFADTGDEVRLPQGDALTVRVTARRGDPEQVHLDYEFAGGERGTEPMRRTGEGEFTWTLDAVLGDATLRAQGGDSLPVELRVRTVERPRLEDLRVRVTHPDYMEQPPYEAPATEGELRLPKGARLDVEGRSHKPIDGAFLLLGGDLKIGLERGPDAHSFRGGFAPPAGGLLVCDVVDRDRLGAATPPKWLLRVGDDAAPVLEFRLRGVSASISAFARIPGELKVRDDFGLREIGAAVRIVEEGTATGGEATGAAPFEPAVAAFEAALPRGARRHETPAVVDLLQWNRGGDEHAEQNRIRPGMLLSLRYHARDNFGPGEPHTGFGETMTFRIVTRDKLVEDLRRRQVEQRQELKRIADEVRAATQELREADPPGAGDRRPQVEARLHVLARQQQALARRTAFVGEAYQRLLWEYENNRLIEANKVRQIETAIPAPLAAVARDDMPAAGRRIEAFAGAGDGAARSAATEACAAVLRRLEAILAQMEQAENLAALLEELRHVIMIEDSAIRDVESRVRDRERDLFGPGKSQQQPR